MEKQSTQLILLVEDHLPTQKIHRNFLEGLAFFVDIAAEGKQALQLFQSQSYAAVLLDKNLPDRDGTEVCRAMRQYEKEKILLPTPIITVTSDASAREICLSAGCNDFATKPISPEGLEVILKRWIKKGCQKGIRNSYPNFTHYFFNDLINQPKECKSC